MHRRKRKKRPKKLKKPMRLMKQMMPKQKMTANKTDNKRCMPAACIFFIAS